MMNCMLRLRGMSEYSVCGVQYAVGSGRCAVSTRRREVLPRADYPRGSDPACKIYRKINPIALFFIKHKYSMMKLYALISFLCFTGALSAQSSGPWMSLFNGKNLEGWTAKISGYEAGNNFADTYRVENGVIKTSYDGYEDNFNNRFGLLFYKTPFSHYRLKLKYRFTGERPKGHH